ncbi:hypothetical protein [Bacillus sp. B-jedd]|uniref:hypothetical protein n=1 Tax=Bacillus sp. B-jedd TaxID=1476857 RepID=UPI000515609F|nr:hypothetical protein [Bacillus sp. B-jedd]CEG28267.1 hypothetical protein BN1002_03153 [Bacillus sp. B-jedd]
MLIIIFLCALLVSACLFFILRPFFAKGQTTLPESTGEKVELETVYEAVNELEMDVLMGKISREDFDSLKKSYYHLAADSVQKEAGVDDDIQAALESIRARKTELPVD